MMDYETRRDLGKWKTGEVKESYLSNKLKDGIFDDGIINTHGMIQTEVGEFLELIADESYIHISSTNLKRGAI